MVRDLVISIFALNGRLVDTGNHLVRDIGLTAAWWQVLGALGYSGGPLPVATIARKMGLSRQSVQRVVDLLGQRDLVRFEVNPHHQRAKLVVLTTEGRSALVAAEAAEMPLNQEILGQIGGARIAIAISVLTEVNELLSRTGGVVAASKLRKDVA